MNFLAHLFLSGNNHELMIGNFIADFVKGKKKDSYPEGIRKGIELHRAIDDFTDHHEVTAESKRRLYPTQHKYAPVVLDLFFDHFLAKNFSMYSDQSLRQYSEFCYQTISEYHHQLPPRVQEFFPYMKEHNWLLNYSNLDGLNRSLTGLSRRVAFPNNMNKSVDDLKKDYRLYEDEFALFFPQLINFARLKLP